MINDNGNNKNLFLYFCQLYNYFEDSNYVYLILEMCHNSEINRYLKKTGRPVGENEGTAIFFIHFWFIKINMLLNI